MQPRRAAGYLLCTYVAVALRPLWVKCMHANVSGGVRIEWRELLHASHFVRRAVLHAAREVRQHRCCIFWRFVACAVHECAPTHSLVPRLCAVLFSSSITNLHGGCWRLPAQRAGTDGHV